MGIYGNHITIVRSHRKERYMNPFSSFLSFLRRTPNSLQVSDWLQNMNDAFLKVAGGILDGDKSSPEMIVYFTLLNTTLSAFNILHGFPSTVSKIGPIYRELRAYYECLWQIFLLGQYTSTDHRDRIAKLYADVDMRTKRTMNSLFSENPNIKQLLECSFDYSYDKRLYEAVREYIHGEHKNSLNKTGNLLNDNQDALSATILCVARLNSTNHPKIKAILCNDTDNALRLKFLTQFDFIHCNFLEFPDEFYK